MRLKQAPDTAVKFENWFQFDSLWQTERLTDRQIYKQIGNNGAALTER